MKRSLKIQNLLRVLFIICTLGLLWSCEDDEENTPQNNSNEDVYVAGAVKSNHFGRATYWKNGVPVTLNEEAKGSTANDIFIDGSDIYVVGSTLNADLEDVPALWINGRQTYVRLTGTTGEINSVFVSGGVIYMAGSDDNVGKLWVSSYGVELRPPSGNSSEFKSVVVVQDMIYVAGFEYEGNVKHAKYWSYSKYGPQKLEAFDLEQFHNEGNFNDANSIVVKDNNIYVAGNNGKNATLWKNNQPTNLYPGDQNFEGTSIFIKGNDVYVSGLGGDLQTNLSWYWKNGVLTNLNRGEAGLEMAHSVAVGKENIYVAGYVRKTTDDWAVLWTNNKPEDMTHNKTRSWAYSVKVVSK